MAADAPVLWTALLGVVCGGLAGAGIAFLADLGTRSITAGLVGAFVGATGFAGTRRLSLLFALATAVCVSAGTVLAVGTTGLPLAAALAMAAVAFLTSIATASPPVGTILGSLVSVAYLLASGLGVVAESMLGMDVQRGAVVSLLGSAGGLATTLAWYVVRRDGREAPTTGSDPAERHAHPPVWAPMIRAVRTFDGHARDGVRRALALGLAMLAFQVVGTRDAFWMLMAAFVVLSPSGKSPLASAIVRVAGTFVGVAALVLVALLLPQAAVVVLGVVSMALSIAYSQRSATLSAAMGAAGAAVLVGLPTGEYAAWALHRLLDTVVGAAIALVVGYLLWPKDPTVGHPTLSRDAPA